MNKHWESVQKFEDLGKITDTKNSLLHRSNIRKKQDFSDPRKFGRIPEYPKNRIFEQPGAKKSSEYNPTLDLDNPNSPLHPNHPQNSAQNSKLPETAGLTKLEIPEILQKQLNLQPPKIMSPADEYDPEIHGLFPKKAESPWKIAKKNWLKLYE